MISLLFTIHCHLLVFTWDRLADDDSLNSERYPEAILYSYTVLLRTIYSRLHVNYRYYGALAVSPSNHRFRNITVIHLYIITTLILNYAWNNGEDYEDLFLIYTLLGMFEIMLPAFLYHELM
jgi:hypothetical protein